MRSTSTGTMMINPSAKQTRSKPTRNSQWTPLTSTIAVPLIQPNRWLLVETTGLLSEIEQSNCRGTTRLTMRKTRTKCNQYRRSDCLHSSTVSCSISFHPTRCCPSHSVARTICLAREVCTTKWWSWRSSEVSITAAPSSERRLQALRRYNCPKE